MYPHPRFVVNVHFDNRELKQNRTSDDGLRIFYTPTLRNDSIGFFHTLQVSVNPRVRIPAGKGRWFLTRRCEVRMGAGREGEAFRLVSASHHAHLLGSEMYVERTRAGGGSTMLT